MRILVHEFATGGGLVGRKVPASLAREGQAMLVALVEDLAAIGRHRILTTLDARFPLSLPRGVNVVCLSPGDATQKMGSDPISFDTLVAAVDAVWLIAPETDRCLERLAGRVERHGKQLLGSGAAVIREASNKARLPHRLRRAGVPHPATRLLRRGADAAAIARALGYPVVVKPARGAGCEGVRLACTARELGRAIATARRAAGPLILQQYVRGTAASVSLLAGAGRVVPLAVNAQHVSASFRLGYRGGRTPLEHPLAERAAAAAVLACSAFPGLRGYVGVDLVLTDTDAVVIEVNARLTTAYLGVRAALDRNVAALILAACDGVLPRRTRPQRQVRFTATGRVMPITVPQQRSA